MRRIYIVVSILLLLSLVHKHTIVSAAAPHLYVKEWDYLVIQSVIQEDELETNWKDAITRIEAVIYLARALKLEPPAQPAVTTTESTEQAETISVE